MSKNKVWFKNLKKQKLCGILEGFKSHNAVLLISGFASGKEEWDDFLVDYAMALNKAGFLTLRFDRAGIGESEGEFLESTLESELDDCIAAYRFLKTKCNNIFIAGHSMGGTLAIMLASRVKPTAIAISSPATSIANVFEKIFTKSQILKIEREEKLQMPKKWQSFGIKFFGKKYWKFRQKFNITKYAKFVKSPTLIIYGNMDGYILLKDILFLFNSLRCEKNLEIIKRGDHSFKLIDHKKKFYFMVIDWFNKH